MELESIVNEEMLTVEDVNEMLDHTDKGRTRQTIRNCVTVLQNDPVLKKAIRRNELSGRTDIVKEVPWKRRSESLTVTDTDDSNLKMYLEENYEITSERVIKAGVDIVSNENKYHPIRDYLEGLVWDGVPRIENLLPRFLGAEKNNYTTGVMKMHMLAAISRIYEPGIKYDIMLCLVGSQGAGKSTFFKYLAIKDDWFSDHLDHLDDENIYRKLQNHWIIEMGEMKATVTAKNIEQIKSFLSRQKETYKIPYEVHPDDMEIEKILTLIDKVSASGLTEFTLEEGNLQLCMKKEKVVKICTEDTAAEQGEVFMEAGKNSVASRNPANHDPEESFTGNIENEENLVCSPLVGTFYLAPSPEEDPFVKPGDTVTKGQTIGIIEAMKLMNEIVAECDGTVEKVLAENGEMVEYGQPLFCIK